MVERRTAAAGAVGPRHSPLQIRPEKLKIHQTIQPLQRVALRRKLLQTLLNIDEPGLTSGNAPGGFWRCGHWGVNRPILGRLPFQRSVANAEPASLCRLGRFPGDDTICIMSADGTITKEAVVATEPESIAICLGDDLTGSSGL